MTRLLVSSIIFLLLAGGVAGAGAYQPSPQQQGAPPTKPAGPAGQGEAPADAMSDAELAAALDAYALVQAQQQLSIADANYRTFAARLKRVQDVRRRNQRARHVLVQQLRRLAGPRSPAPGDDTEIRAQLTLLRDHDERAAAELRQAYDALDEVLDVRQQARLRLFEEQIEQRKLDLLVRARERAFKGRQ